jgi:hypothetical protein
MAELAGSNLPRLSMEEFKKLDRLGLKLKDYVINYFEARSREKINEYAGTPIFGAPDLKRMVDCYQEGHLADWKQPHHQWLPLVDEAIADFFASGAYQKAWEEINKK